MKDEFAIFLRSVARRFRVSRALESLPDVSDMERRFERGVCLYEGYQRGTPLKYGSLFDQAQRDPLYRRAIAASRLPEVRSIVDEARCVNLFLLIKFFLRELSSQNIVEFGAYKGGNAIFMAMLQRELHPDARVVAMDTFCGIPGPECGVDNPPQDFTGVNLDRIRATARSLGLTNLEYVPGLIEDTAAGVCRGLGSIGLAHIDVVLHGPSAYARTVVWEFMTPGGYIVQDDALDPNCPGATLAVQELIRERGPCIEQFWPHIVVRAGRLAA